MSESIVRRRWKRFFANGDATYFSWRKKYDGVEDLRDEATAPIQCGEPQSPAVCCRAAAARFGVSVSSAIRWRRALVHGQAIAEPRGGDRHSGKIEAHRGFIRELIAEQGDMTLVEVQARLIERGAPVGIGTVHRFFVRHGITRKKRPGTRSSRTVPTS